MSTPGVMARPLAILMNRAPRTIHVTATLAEAAVRMRDERVGALLVKDGDRHVGLISETDLVRRGMAVHLDPQVEQVRRVMSQPLVSISIERTAHDASDLMAEHGIRHLVVTEDHEIVGMLSVRDLLRYFKNWGG
ncbi:MAG: CBS domain-containing protein [Nitrospiraceae bacterium]